MIKKNYENSFVKKNFLKIKLFNFLDHPYAFMFNKVIFSKKYAYLYKYILSKNLHFVCFPRKHSFLSNNGLMRFAKINFYVVFINIEHLFWEVLIYTRREDTDSVIYTYMYKNFFFSGCDQLTNYYNVKLNPIYLILHCVLSFIYILIKLYTILFYTIQVIKKK